METKIYYSGSYRNIKPDSAIPNTKAMTSFCVYNCMRNALTKSQGGWYWIGMDGLYYFVARALYLISYNDLYNLRNL